MESFDVLYACNPWQEVLTWVGRTIFGKVALLRKVKMAGTKSRVCVCVVFRFLVGCAR
jgi:hypothetical protein